MQVPGGYRAVAEPGAAGVVRTDLAELPLASWWREGDALPGARGRGRVTVLAPRPGLRGVARTYLRGGALARLLPAAFADAERATRELCALVDLGARGVPVVTPLAAVRRRRGLLWQLRLVTELVPGASPLPSFLAAHPELASRAVREAGRVVRAAFDAGLLHPDLHPDNLLVTTQPAPETGSDPEPATPLRVVLLDLDRARVVDDAPRRDRDRMLLRMARYLERHAAGLPITSRTVDILRFLDGMGLDRPARRAEFRRLEPAYERAVARHRLSWGRHA